MELPKAATIPMNEFVTPKAMLRASVSDQKLFSHCVISNRLLLDEFNVSNRRLQSEAEGAQASRISADFCGIAVMLTQLDSRYPFPALHLMKQQMDEMYMRLQKDEALLKDSEIAKCSFATLLLRSTVTFFLKSTANQANAPIRNQFFHYVTVFVSSSK